MVRDCYREKEIVMDTNIKTVIGGYRELQMYTESYRCIQVVTDGYRQLLINRDNKIELQVISNRYR